MLHQRGVVGAGLGDHDRRLLVGALVEQREVLEAVAQRLREVAGGDVLHGVLRRHHLEAVGRAHLADVRQLQQALVERRQQHVLHALGHAVELVDEQHLAVAHRLDQRPGEERLFPVPLLEHERRVEPAGELALGVAVVAVDAHGVAAEVAADGQGDGGLAHAHGALEQQVAAGAEHGQRGGQLALAADDAVLLLDLLDGGHVVTFVRWRHRPCRDDRSLSTALPLAAIIRARQSRTSVAAARLSRMPAGVS